MTREEFLKPEIRCDTFISAERKAAWKVMLDILECFIGICERHDIHYTMDGGSLLGVIRHGGIIPWDDDIDVNVPREEYDTLLPILKKELPKYYFAQTSCNDAEYPITHLKIRDTRTSGIDPYHAGRKMRFNMGIFLDVFPLDGVPERKPEQARIVRMGLFLRKIRRNAFVHNCKSLWAWVKHFYGAFMFRLIGNERLYRLREELFADGGLKGHCLCTTTPSEWGYRAHESWPTECFDSYIDMPFEYLTVKVPSGYLRILEITFGDWHQFIKGVAGHNPLILDAHRSYKEILKERFSYTDKELSLFPNYGL